MTQTIELTGFRTIRELAEESGVSTQYIHKLIKAGHVEAIRTPLGFLIHPDVFDAFCKEREAKNAEAAA